MDKVLDAYKNLAITVSAAVYDAAAYSVGNVSLDDIYNALDELAALYGMDLELAATAFKEHNDLAAHADKLRGDALVLIRIVGTLSVGLAEIGSCIYDVDQSLRTPEVIGNMLGTVLVLSELGTQSDNILDGYQKGRIWQGEQLRKRNLKLSNADVASIKSRLVKGRGGNCKELAAEFGVHWMYILQVAKGYHDGRKRD